MKRLIILFFTVVLFTGCAKNVSVSVMNSWIGQNKSAVTGSLVWKTGGWKFNNDNVNELIYSTSETVDAGPSGSTKDNNTGAQLPTPPSPEIKYTVEYHFILVDNKVHSWKIVYHNN